MREGNCSRVTGPMATSDGAMEMELMRATCSVCLMTAPLMTCKPAGRLQRLSSSGRVIVVRHATLQFAIKF